MLFNNLRWLLGLNTKSNILSEKGRASNTSMLACIYYQRLYNQKKKFSWCNG